MNGISQFSAIASREKIDTEKGIIFGVSVITIGQAQGKNSGTWIDRTSLSQIHAVASKYPDGVKVKLSQSKEHDGSAGQIVGVLKNFRVDGNHERADLHLLKSDENFHKILEMSATMPSEFGLSVVVPKELEKVDGKDCLRCSEIYSIDLVEAPAANPTGLFSTQIESMSNIKYAKGDSGDHANDCECKECMSKHSKKEMTAMFAKMLGLNESANEQEIAEALKASKGNQVDIAPLTAKITELTSKISAFETDRSNAVALAKKAEIDAAVFEASREGKKIPYENDDLYTVKDGIVTIHTEPVMLRKVISKLEKAVQLSRRTTFTAPKSKDGGELKGQDLIAFNRDRRAQGEAELSRIMFAQMTPGN